MLVSYLRELSNTSYFMCKQVQNVQILATNAVFLGNMYSDQKICSGGLRAKSQRFSITGALKTDPLSVSFALFVWETTVLIFPCKNCVLNY